MPDRRRLLLFELTCGSDNTVCLDIDWVIGGCMSVDPHHTADPFRVDCNDTSVPHRQRATQILQGPRPAGQSRPMRQRIGLHLRCAALRRVRRGRQQRTPHLGLGRSSLLKAQVSPCRVRSFWAGSARANGAVHADPRVPFQRVTDESSPVCIGRSSVVAAGLPGSGAGRPLRSMAVAAFRYF